MSRNQWTLVGIAALFGLPLVAAWLMQSGLTGWRPAETVNLGLLVEPPLALDLAAWVPPAAADGRWRMLYRLPAPCERPCEDAVTGLRQVHRASGRHRDHIAVVLLSDAPPDAAARERFRAIYPDFELHADPSGEAAADLAEAVQRTGTGAASVAGWAFVLDPAGNVILAYANGFDPNHVNRDLKRLLTWSASEE